MKNKEKTCPLMNKNCETISCMWYCVYKDVDGVERAECVLTLIGRNIP